MYLEEVYSRWWFCVVSNTVSPTRGRWDWTIAEDYFVWVGNYKCNVKEVVSIDITSTLKHILERNVEQHIFAISQYGMVGIRVRKLLVKLK